ncbi:chorismate-binding protein [Arthrobacter sp. zg-Y916]|uniref:chorismate-binding protein n=1 Tax=Arthrobacter sp. zg-Y916 TaxID=2894190 RepID=UPI001E4F152B|nr:chorismate-binding protein [Arthrobacter sp. zg-Y916]MCC9192362.1 chorismate-binding protein [Arthrobacter sp. zg-Y916]
MPPASARPLLIGIDGFSGAGKTSLALELAAQLRAHRSVALFHLEDVYPGWDGLAAGMDYYRGTVLEPLAAGEEAHWQAWDWQAGRYGPRRTTVPAEIVIFEGVGAAHRAARQLLDAVVWVDAPEAERRERALARDGDTYAPHWNRWAAQEARWAAADPAQAGADLQVAAGESTGRAPLHAYVLRALGSLPLPAPGLGLPQSALQVDAEILDADPDPLQLYSELFGSSGNAVWLDSSDAGTAGAGGSPAERSRFSIMADDGGLLGRYAEHAAGTTRVSHGPVQVAVREPFFRWLHSEWGTASVPQELDCPFALGWVGCLGYGLKRETGGADVPFDVPFDGPDAALVFTGRAVVLDHVLKRVFLLTLKDPWFDGQAGSAAPSSSAALSGSAVDSSSAARSGEAWLESARRAVAASSVRAAASAVAGAPGGPASPQGWRPAGSGPAFSFRDSRADYQAKVRLAQAHIAEGNTYEACLTTQLRAELPEELEPQELLDLYAALRRRSPAPFASFLRLGNLVLAGTSPERFLRISAAGNLRAEPIKGTRPRGGTPAADAELRQDLLRSDKDRAENIMIVDLMRNDLSRLAEPGSVTVPRLCVVESYATVHQLVSTIDARLASGASRAEAIAAAFPAGSMTGAPKSSTMTILDRLEGAARGMYSGAAGYFSLTGAADLSVVIRTLVLSPKPGGVTVLSLGVGGAVTSGSDPKAEWQEVRTKARGVLGSLGSAVPED